VLTAAKFHAPQAAEGTKFTTLGSGTLEVKGTTWNTIQTDSKGVIRKTATVKTSGSDMTTTPTCEFPKDSKPDSVETAKYEADGTTLRLLTKPAGATASFQLVYTKK
jgi:hypothetical protein